MKSSKPGSGKNQNKKQSDFLTWKKTVKCGTDKIAYSTFYMESESKNT
jgi:hypothetical protein